MISILQLAAARTELWFSGKVPSHYEILWEEARTALSEWPGFARLSLSAEDLEEMQELGEMTDDFHAAFNAEVGERVEVEVAPGIFQVVGTKDLSQLDTDESEPDD